MGHGSFEPMSLAGVGGPEAVKDARPILRSGGAVRMQKPINTLKPYSFPVLEGSP